VCAASWSRNGIPPDVVELVELVGVPAGAGVEAFPPVRIGEGCAAPARFSSTCKCVVCGSTPVYPCHDPPDVHERRFQMIRWHCRSSAFTMSHPANVSPRIRSAGRAALHARSAARPSAWTLNPDDFPRIGRQL
jgi:hypothetical protein